MKRRLLRSLAAGLGVTTICCLWIVGPLVAPSHNAVYHWSGPASTIFIPPTLDFLSVWIFFSFLLFVAQGEKRGALILWAGTTLLLPWAALKNGAWLTYWRLPHWISRNLFGLCMVAFLVFCVYWRPDHRHTLERLRRVTIDFLCILAVYGVFILIQLTWFGWQARRLNVPLALHQTTKYSTQAMVGHPRIIWILLDELSYQQVYGHRFHTLDLPAFDRLAKQSTVFTDVAPAGIMTEIVMPSLITGLPVDQIRSSSNGVSLKLHNPRTEQWQLFNQHDTIFGDALTAGYSTAIAGWYNPYCRILPEVLDRCFWTLAQPAPDVVLERASIVSTMLNSILLSSSIMNHLLPASTLENKADVLGAETHISDYRRLSDAADQLLQTNTLDFILIHMDVPHPSGIYNRTTHTFATHNATYIDNLALADSYLAHVRSLLEAEGKWDSSAIVIMGDHSWRTELLWAGEAHWTPEEQEASDGGRFDDRPGYIVKLPRQNYGTAINTRFEAVNTRRLFKAIMQKQIISPQDLSAWVEMLDRKRSQK